MTREEAKDELKFLKKTLLRKEEIEALDMAISALKQYDGNTNGEVMQSLFPNDLWLHIYARRAKKEWWNSPYKKGGAE